MKNSISRLGGPLLAMLLASCASMPAASDAPPLDGTAWVLSALPGGAPISGSRATLSFEGGRAQGSDGCNRFGMPVTIKGSTIEVGNRGVSTMMACAPEVMKQAEAFTSALSSAKSYRIADGQLQLLGAGGAVLATLAAQSRSLAGSWSVTGINNGRNAVVSVAGGTTVTMVFADDKTVAGSAGCNQFNARYEAEGSKFRFTAPAATRRMCPGAGVMEQEQSFLKALEAVTTMRLEGNRLEFRDDKGALQVTATREGGK